MGGSVISETFDTNLDADGTDMINNLGMEENVDLVLDGRSHVVPALLTFKLLFHRFKVLRKQI